MYFVHWKMAASINGDAVDHEGDEQKPLLNVGNNSSSKSDQISYEYEETLPDGKTSVIGAAFIVGNAAIGGGLLAVPYAFYSAGGAISGSLLEAAFATISLFTLVILAFASEVKQAATVQKIMHRFAGLWGGVITDFIVFLYSLATCIVFLVIIGDQVEDIAANFQYNVTSGNSSEVVHYNEQWYLSRQFTVSVWAVVCILPMLMFKNIGALSYTSILGVISLVYITIVMIVKYFIFVANDSVYECAHPRNIPSSCSPATWQDFFNALPILCFSYQCQMSSIPIYAGLKKRSVKRFTFSLTLAMLLCFSIYTPVGIFGYLMFQHECLAADILRNYCADDIAVDVGRFMLATSVTTSYPILHFCGRTAIETVLKKFISAIGRKKGSAWVEVWLGRLDRWEGTRLRILGLVWFVVTLTLAIFIPNILVVVNPAGALAAMFVLVFPGICLLRYVLVYPLTEKHSVGCSIVLRILLGSFAVFLLGMGFFVFGNSWTYSILSDTHLL